MRACGRIDKTFHVEIAEKALPTQFDRRSASSTREDDLSITESPLRESEATTKTVSTCILANVLLERPSMARKGKSGADEQASDSNPAFAFLTPDALGDFTGLSEAEGRRRLAQHQQDPNSIDNAVALAEDRETYGEPTRDTPYVLPPDYPACGPYKPTRYTPELAMRFCELVASTTMTLQQIGRQCGVPANIFLKWCSRYDELGQSYACAREAQQHLRADELLEIADNSSNDWMEIETKSGRLVRVFDHEHAKRSEIRIRTRQWLMSRFAPRVYGERLQIEQAAETRAQIAAKSEEERLREAIELIAEAKRRIAEAFESGEVSDPDFEERRKERPLSGRFHSSC